MQEPAPRSSILVLIIALVTAVVVSKAASHAVQWYGHPFPGVLVTADGSVSSIGMPTWSGIAQGLRFPDRVESVDGAPLVYANGDYPARVWDRVVDEAVAGGRGSVHVRVLAASGARELDLRLERLDAASWWVYAGTTIFMAGLYALAALIALTSSPRGTLARAFAKFALLAAYFFATIFDTHTTRTMVPLFHATFAWVGLALVGLALRLPDDVPLVKRHPWVPRALDVAGMGLAAVVVARDFLGQPVIALQGACTLLFGGAMIAFVVILGIRYARASGTRRDLLRVLFRACATPYALVGVGLLFSMLSSRGSAAAFFAIPALALAPIATGVVFVQHDVWGSRALLSRVVTRSLASAVACVLAMGAGAAFAASVGVPFRGAFIAAGAGAAVSTVLVLLVSRAVERRFFPAVAEYKPTIEQLSEELTSIADPKQLAVAVERTVRRWLPCERVEFRAVAVNATPPSTGPKPEELHIPTAFGGETLGWIIVGRKRGGALFTTDDLDLLNTIANQAALALAYALSYAELEQRRRQQAAAWQTERVALVETVAAEIAHEVRYPINFFRAVFRRDKKNARLDDEEIDIGCEEVERLERLVSGLRRIVGHRIERRQVTVADLAARVEMLLRDSLLDRPLDVKVPADAALRCDPDQATQVLVNLVANAIDATGPRGSIGVKWTATDEGADLVVWDDGPGFEGEASQLFAPWFTTKPRGTGLGLAITQRIVRAHGWSIDVTRSEGQTRFAVSIPGSDVVGGERRTPTEPGREAAVAHGDGHA
jgi:nitrogen-specific signal transduction histidine kinase